MQWGLAGAFASAAVYGVATVLQALAVRRTERQVRLDPRLLLRLAHSRTYVLAMFCEAIGFGLSLAAIRTLPLFVVQAVVASSLAWTAVLAAVFLDTRLGLREWGAIAVVVTGLGLLASSAGDDGPSHVDFTARAALLGSVGAIFALGAAASRRGASSFALGTIAGLGFSSSGIGARVLADPTSPLHVVTDPAFYALCLGGLVGLLVSAQAFQRGSVTVTTAAVTATSTLVPAGIGLALLGDHPSPGQGVTDAVGFCLTLAGALALAHHGNPEAAAPAQDSEADGVRVGETLA
jgi:drug/metabolite transporter (DMT)-like permease